MHGMKGAGEGCVCNAFRAWGAAVYEASNKLSKVVDMIRKRYRLWAVYSEMNQNSSMLCFVSLPMVAKMTVGHRHHMMLKASRLHRLAYV